MNAPLVAPIEGINDQAFQELIGFFNETLGFCPNSVRTMYHRPQIAFAFIELNKAVIALKRLIGYVSSNVTGCRYCQAHTIRAAERYGAEALQLENIWEFRTHEAFSDAERAALEFAIASSMVPNAVTSEVSDNLRKYWNEGEIVEILGVVALFGYLNRWNDSMGTTLEAPAIESGEKYLSKKDWTVGKHGGGKEQGRRG